ncbi:MAG: threonylcarbamoyl-AMP synthase [Desulfarculales bacterium]|jgi:L-threonylcarbamoyladenylate synthase|nr:threonylcarbamoyl-AMP synthase [Desulfarculales bacterium]
MRIKIDPAVPDSSALEKAVAALARGGVIIYPTETFYALGADAANSHALEKVLALKRRRSGHSLPLIAAGPAQISPLLESKETPQLYGEITARFWPGPLTLVLPARRGLAAALLSPPAREGGCSGVALRVSSLPLASALAQGLGRAVTSTSANMTGQPACRDGREIDPILAAAADIFLDGGLCPGGPASTIVDLRLGPPFKILRSGPIILPSSWICG